MNQSQLQFEGLWRAKVLDNVDPKKRHRIQVEILMDSTESILAIWAYPLNNAFGNSDPGNLAIAGQQITPPIGSYVYILFEANRLDKARYLGGLNIDYGEGMPEFKNGKNPQDKHILLRLKSGRIIIMSDDPNDERVQLTGKKRIKYGIINAKDHCNKIEDNQSTIIIDDRKGKEKIIIADYKGNYINIDSKKDQINIKSKTSINIKSKECNIVTENAYNIQSKELHITGNAIIEKVMIDGNVDIGGNLNAAGTCSFGSTANAKPEKEPSIVELPDIDKVML